MELWVDYATNQLNGFSTISSINPLPGLSWGVPSCNAEFAVIPVNVNKPDIWNALIYKYNTSFAEWIFYQQVEMPSTSLTSVASALSDGSFSKYVFLLNNYQALCHVYAQNVDNTLSLFQTISLPNTPPNATKTIAAWGDYLAVGDYTAEIVTLYQTTGGAFEVIATIPTPTSGIEFGRSVAMAQWSSTDFRLFVGATKKTNIAVHDGSVFVYEGLNLVQQIIAPAADVDGFFGFNCAAEQSQLIVGAPGADTSRGRAYVFIRGVVNWTLQDTLSATPAGAVNDQFGSYVSIYANQAAVCAGNEALGAGALYTFAEAAGTWNFVDRHTHVGSVGYAQSCAIAPNSIFTSIVLGDFYLLTYNLGVWTEASFLQLNMLYILTTTDGSVYHTADGNTTLILQLSTPIQYDYLIELSLKNSMYTIDDTNNTVYFVELDGVYRSNFIPNGTYTEGDLAAAVELAMNEVGNNTYQVTYNAPANKYHVCANGLFAFGSNSTLSFKNAIQNKVMGFYDNNNSILATCYVSDAEADLAIPTNIGVNILEGIPLRPVRHNNPFAEVGLVATLNTGGTFYEIARTEEQRIRFPQKTSVLTFVFPSLDGGKYHNINTNVFSIKFIR